MVLQTLPIRIVTLQANRLRRFHQHPAIGGGVRIVTSTAATGCEGRMLHRHRCELFGEFMATEAEYLLGIIEAVFVFGTMRIVTYHTSSSGDRAVNIFLIKALYLVLMTREALPGTGLPDNMPVGRVTFL